MNEAPPSLTFSHEEIVLLLGLLRVPTMPGIGTEPFAGLSPEQTRLLLGSAERSLQARGLLRWQAEGDTLHVEKFVLALLGPCCLPEFSVIVTRGPKDGLPETVYVHAAQTMIVEHAVTGPALHTFAAFRSWDEVMPRLLAFLDVQDAEAAPSLEGTISEDLLGRATQTADREGAPAATALLEREGIPAALAGLLARGLQQRKTNLALAAVDHRQGDTPVSAFVLTMGGGGLWLFKMNGQAPNYTVAAVSAIDVKARLSRLVPTSYTG